MHRSNSMSGMSGEGIPDLANPTNMQPGKGKMGKHGKRESCAVM